MLSYAETRGAHGKARQFMAKVTAYGNGWLTRVIAVGAAAIVVGVVAWTLATVMTNSTSNSIAISSINARLANIEDDVRALADD